MKQIKAERDAADAEVKRWEAAARAVADKAAQGESAAAEEQTQTVDNSKTEELAAADAEERASGSGEQNPQKAEPSERGGGTDEYQTPKEAEAEKTIYTEQEQENLYRRFNEQQRKLFTIREEMRQLLGGTSMEDYKKADAERRAKADELIAQHNEIRQSISHNDLKALSIYLWRRLGKLMKEVDEMEGDTPRALGDELNRLSNDHSSVTRALRDHYDDSNLYHVGVRAEAEQTDKADAKADARYPFDTDRVREQRGVFLSPEESRKAEIEYFRRADKNGGLRLATDEKRNEDDEDDPDAVETKMYVPVYTVRYFADMNSSSNPRVREYDTVDEALANMRYDYELSDRAPYSQLEVKFKEVWVDKDGDVIEEDDEPRSLYDIARKVKLPDEMQQYEGEDSIILHDETFTTGKEINEEKEEEIRDEIEKVLSKETYVLDGKEVHLNVGSLGKYTDIEVLDADGELMGSFTLRIADHSYNPRNNTTAQLAGNFISVVVNYDDPTAEKFHGRYNIHAGIDDSADSVADEVNERVQEIIDEWDADKEHPRYSLVTPESEMTVQEQEAALRDALVGKLEDAGIDVVTDSEQAQRVINEANGEARLQASLGGLKKASDFILSFLKGGTRQRSSKFEIPERANRLAEKAIGHKINSHTINANELTHAKKRHGVNGSANTENSIPLRDEDFSLMPYIMSAPTRVVKGSMSSNGTESVRYEKDLSNGVVIVVEREGRFDVSDMENITMWAQKKSATNVTVAPRASHSTSETIVISETDAARIRKDAENAIRNDEKLREQKVNGNADVEARDREYLEAVERGDKAKAQQMVEDYASRNGYNLQNGFYVKSDFDEQKPRRFDLNAYEFGRFLHDKYNGEEIDYRNEDYEYEYQEFGNLSLNDIFSASRMAQYYFECGARGLTLPEHVFARRIGLVPEGQRSFNYRDEVYEYGVSVLGLYDESGFIEQNNGTYRIFNDGKEYVVEGFYGGLNGSDGEPLLTHARVLGDNHSIIKSSDAVTYDDKGNVIPLSERFNSRKSDVRYFRTPGGDAYGFTVGGRIYVDTRIATAETPIHEYAHLWATALRQTNPAEWQNVVELMKGTGIWDSVRAGYPELTSDDGIADEVLAHYSGRRGAERLREAQREALAGDGVMTAKLAAMEGIRRVREALERFWRGVADFLGIHFTTAEEVADKVLSDLLHGVDPTSAATDAALRMDGKDETGELVAVHNLTEDRLKDALELGGFPMPSIAITKADMGHTTFGDISLLFGRDTIDPGRSENKVYGEDAYTPMFPKIGYKINDDRAEEIQRRAYDAGRMPFFSPAEFAPMNYQYYIDGMNPEGIVEHFMADYGAKQLYLSEKGEAVREEVTKKRKKFPDEQAKRIDAMLDEIGLERLKAFDKRHPDEEVIDAVTAVYGENKDGIMSDSAGRRRMADMIASIVDYAENGNETTEKDPEATRAKIDERIYRDDFERWLRDMFAGIVEKRGLRNNKDLLTPSGKRRRWESLYDEVTLDNVVRHMASQSPKGGEGLFGGSTIGAAQKKYRTMADIRKEARERIRQQSDEEAKQARDEINSRLNALEIPENGNLFDWHIAVRNAVAKSDKASGIYKYLKEDYPTVTMETAKEIEGIVKDIRKMSARFFEAKPYRAVGFDEVKLAVVPSGTSAEVLDALRRRGIAVREYEAGNQEQRKEMVSEATRELNLRFQKEQGTFDGSNAEMADIVARAKADGTYLKAPNGKPSNLSPRQWAQVRTKAFKEWFGNWELAQKVLNIVAAVKEHGFKNFADAKAWANDNIVRTLTNEETGGKGEIRISNNAVSKFLSESAVAKSESKDVHLSVLKVLPDVIRESVDAEQHPDYKKGADGKRSAENGINDNVTIHRLYGAVDIDGKTYRVKVTLKEYTDSNRPQKAYSYEATKIELLAGTLVGGKTSNPSTNNSISAAKLLENVESSTKRGKKLLDCSKVVDENGEPLVVHHVTDAEFYAFDRDRLGENTDGNASDENWAKTAHIGFWFNDMITPEKTFQNRQMDVYLNMNNPYKVRSMDRLAGELDGITAEEFAGYIADRGFDGIVVVNDEEFGGTSYVAVDAGQIKSATDNVGTFSSQNPDIRYQFIGEKGAAAMDKSEEASVRLDNLAVARDMEQSGKDAKTVKLATGWERGGDGKWRYEIGDGKFDAFGNLHPERRQLSEEEKKFLKETSEEFDRAFDRGLELTDSERAVDVCVAGGMERSKAERIIYLNKKRLNLSSGPKMLDDYLDNDDLFAAYPELRKIRVIEGNARGILAGVLGVYNPVGRTLLLYDMSRDTLLHEVQHAIQRIEGFATGGSSKTVRQRIEELIYDNTNSYEYTKSKLSLYAEAKIHEFFLAGSYDTRIKSDDPSIRKYAIERYWDAMRFIDNNDRSSLVNEYPDLPSDEIALSGYHVKEAAEELRRLAKSYKDDIPEGNMDVLNLVQKLERFLKEKNNKELYAALGGEVESRNVQKRLDMTEEARRASLASETEDVAREDQIFLYDGLNYAAESRVEENDIEEVNERFNEELERYEKGETAVGTRFELGMPSKELQSAGFPYLPISMRASLLSRKAGIERHPFKASDLKDLVKAIQRPIAVFRYSKDNMRNLIVDVTHGDKHFLIGITLDYKKGDIEVNSVSGLFPKESHEWVKWIQDGKAIRIDQKEKVLDLIDSLRTNPAESERIGLDLVSAAEIVKNFENPSIGGEKNENVSEDTAVYRIREDAPPAKTGVGYKVFVLKNGKLYPPMVANPRGEATPVGVWLDADAAPVAGMTKTGRQQVKAGGKGTQGGSGKLAYRPGWHLGEIPYAMQFNRLNPETGQRELFPANFVWAEVEYADDVDYQEEAMSYGMNANGKFQHSLAGLPRLPKNGSYKYRTNPDPNTDAWVITGAMKVNRILKPSEVDAMVEAAGREPQRRQNDAVTDEQIDALNREIEGTMKKDASMKRKTAEQMGARLHTPVNIIEDAESVTHPDPEEQARRRNAKGWYDPASGLVNIVIGNNANVDDVAATVFHEVVAHKGLREMIGRERYDEFLDEIYDHLRASTKKAVDADAARMFANEPLRGYRQHRRVAMDELLGRLAEKGFEDFTAEEQGIWERLKEKVIEAINGFLGALKLPKWVRLGDNELRYILWRSHEQMRSRDGEVDAVRDEAKREALGLEPTQEDILFRTKGNKEYNGDKVLWDNNLSIYDNLMAYVMREAESVKGEAKSVRVQKQLRKSARLVSRLSPSLTRSR